MVRISIVFWGEDTFSNVVLLSLINAGYNVKGVVTPHYNNFNYKKLEITCKKYGIDLLRTKSVNGDEVREFLIAKKPDLCAIAHFEKLIKRALLEIPPLGFINLHPSMLPDYRGMAPQHWPIINGEKETAVTVHKIDEGTDTGDIIIQEIIKISDEDYVSDLQKKWLQIYKHIMVDAIERLTTPGFKGTKQSHLSGRYYGKLHAEDCQINPNGTIFDAYRLIRGVSMPYHGAQWGEYILWKAHMPSVEEVNAIKLNSSTNGFFELKDNAVLQLNSKILIIDKFQRL
jgi:methionyl-tRNA formyltransferase